MFNRCCCKEESKITKGIDVSKMEEELVELSVNANTWETLYRCKQCGEFWEERYTGGRWDGWPELYKVSPEFVAEKWGPEYVK